MTDTKTTVAKQDQAIQVAISWLQACRIPAKKMGKTVIVIAKGGTPITVLFSEPVNGSNAISVSANDMASSDRHVAMQTFWKVTEAAGYGSPKPVDRGADLEKRIYGDEFFLSVARHKEFRHAPDLSTEKLKQFEPVYRGSTGKFFNRNSALCNIHGYQISDLLTFALVWTHIFVHKYYREDIGEINNRILAKYLKHRFSEFWQHLVRQGRSQFPSPDTVHIALLGEVIDSNHYIERFSVDPRKEKPEEPHGKEISAARKRRAAAKVLRANLSSLPHDDMVRLLLVAANCQFRDYATRKEARRLVIVHAKKCEQCQKDGVLRKMEQSRKSLLSERGLSYSNERAGGGDTSGAVKDVSDDI